MSGAFFEELDIPSPDMNLEVGSGRHGWQTAQIIERLERYFFEAGYPDWLVVFGDTNSTLAASLVGSKLHVPIAHVEAGLRSFDRSMPEEVNRVVTDRLSRLLFCPSQAAIGNLAREGMRGGARQTGDIMYDSILRYRDKILSRADQIGSSFESDRWAVLTVHRPANTDRADRMEQLMRSLRALEMPIVWPIHPRTRARLGAMGLEIPDNVEVIDPVGYLSMLGYIRAASCILTDSGGIQKEAFWLETPCVTLRDTTEWPETLEHGWNTLAEIDTESVVTAVFREEPGPRTNPYGDGTAAQQMVRHLILQ
jgi:UDP-N-acetylglucosamine 2-epimerase